MNKLKKATVLVLAAVILLSLASCANPNQYSLVYLPDGTENLYYIYSTDDYVVYVYGGIVKSEDKNINASLDKVFADKTLTPEMILESAEKFGEKEKIEVILRSDSATKEYIFPSFTLVKFDTPNCRDIYFLPNGMHSYDVEH